jgi:hypothetical protein
MVRACGFPEAVALEISTINAARFFGRPGPALTPKTFRRSAQQASIVLFDGYFRIPDRS